MDELFFIGQILLLPYSFTPRGVLPCDGRSLVVAQRQALYSLIMNKYGGDNTNFKLPDLRGAEPIPGMAFYIVVEGYYPTRS